MVGLWTFEEPAGTVAYDRTVNQGHALVGSSGIDRPTRISGQDVFVPVERTNLNLIRDAAAFVRGFEGKISVANAGNADADLGPVGEFSDLVVGDDHGAHMFHGRFNWITDSVQRPEDFEGSPIFRPNTNAWFRSGLKNGSRYNFPGDNSTIPWTITTNLGDLPGHSSQSSLHFGTANDYDVSGIVGGTLHGPSVHLNGATEAELSFNYYLETEQLEGVDIARVRLAFLHDAAPQLEPLDIIASNQLGDLEEGVVPLVDGSGEWLHFTYTIPQSIISQLQTFNRSLLPVFEFNAVDNVNNHHPGWYIDDVKVTILEPLHEIRSLPLIPGQSNSVAGLGDVNFDGGDDWAIVVDPSGSGQDAVNVHLSDGGTWNLTRLDGFDDFRIVPASDIDGDSANDFFGDWLGRQLSHLWR